MNRPPALLHFAFASTTAIKAIPPTDRGNLTLHVVDASTGYGWTFLPDSVAAASSSVLVPDAGNGRWIQDATITGGASSAALASTDLGEGSALIGDSDAGSIYTATTVAGQLQEVKLLADASTAIGPFKRTVTVGHADLTEAVNNTSQAINVGATLPANARILGVDMRALTVFTGGSVSAVTCDVGTSGDVDSLIDGADLQTTAVDSGPATMPAGIRPNKAFITIGAQLIATFYPDSGHALLALTAGSVIIDVTYMVLA